MVAEADMAETGMAYDINSGNFNRFKGDAKIFAHFFLQPIQDDAESSVAGRPIFKDEEFIRIIVPGDKKNIVVRPAMKMDKERFAQQYAKFKNNEEQSATGTHLEKWAGVTRAQVEELKHFGVRTVEQLALIDDTNAQKFMGIMMLRNRARDYVEAAKGEAPTVALRAELAERDNKIEALQKAIEEMRSMLEAQKED